MNPERTWIWVDVLHCFLQVHSLVMGQRARTRVHPNRLKEKRRWTRGGPAISNQAVCHYYLLPPFQLSSGTLVLT